MNSILHLILKDLAIECKACYRLWQNGDYMTKEELINLLNALLGDDPEGEHRKADELLLDYIGDEDIRKAFDEIEKWYS
jgi:hypothetical protein